jgi:hypothetical protein
MMMNTFRLNWVLGAASGLFFFTVVGLLLANVIYPVHFAGLILLTAVIVMVAIVAQMVTTGKVKAKGAKKRRARLLPMFYKKKNKAVTKM